MTDLPPDTHFIGVGDPLRGDDSVGPRLARALAARGLDAHACRGDGADLLALLRPRGAVALIDATRTGRPPGSLIRVDLRARPMRTRPPELSSHRFGLAQAVEIARVLGALPETLLLFGVEGRDFTLGAPLSPPVAQAAGRLLRALVAETGARERLRSARSARRADVRQAPGGPAQAD